MSVRRWAHQGSSRIRQAPVVDPALIRALDVGQAAYIYRGGVTYVQVKRLVGAPAALAVPTGLTVPTGQTGPTGPTGPTERTGPATPAELSVPTALAGPAMPRGHPPPPPAAAVIAPGRPGAAPAALPDASSLLDEAFGPEPAP